MNITESRSLVESAGEATFNLRDDVNANGVLKVGKFEGQTPLCVVLHEWATSGAADDEAGDVQAGGHFYGFVLTPDEALALGVKRWLTICEDSDGFVELDEYDSPAQYRKVLADAAAVMSHI